jgi:hypothetical protein
MMIESVAKHGDKSSAFELSINYIYKLPLPRERVALNIVSPFSFGEQHTGQVPTAHAANLMRGEGRQRYIDFD